MGRRTYRNRKPGFLIIVLIILVIVILVQISKAVDRKKAQDQANYNIIMQEALEDTSGFKVIGNKAVYCGNGSYSTSYIPEAYIAQTPEEVRYIVRGESGEEIVGHYSDMTAAIKCWLTLTVEDLATGEVLGSCQFWGGDPPYTKGTDKAIKTYPNIEEILDWVQHVLDTPVPEPTAEQPTEEIPEESDIPQATEDQEQEQDDALAAALKYLSYDFGESPQTLTNYLTFEGFSEQAAAYAVEHCNADWMEEAVKCSAFILENYDHVTNKDEMIYQLEQWGFTSEQAVHAADLAEYP